MSFARLRLIGLVVLAVSAGAVFAADSVPVSRVTLYDSTESTAAGYVGDRLKVDATFSVLPTVTANQGTQGTSTSPWYVNLRSQNGTELATLTNPAYTSSNYDVVSPLTEYVARLAKVVATGATTVSTFTLATNIALTGLQFGGRGPGQADFFIYNVAASQLVPSGGFNSSGDVSTWTNTGIGSSAGIAWVYNTSQFVEGTGSASHTFTQSDSNNHPEITYTWATPQDLNNWRYLIARARVTVAAGGAQTRTISVILEDTGGATRTYSLAGTTTTAPFSTEQWHTITAEITTPTTSSGTFDPYSVSKVHLRLQDGGNKTGTIYWDNIHFEASQTLIDRIYGGGNSTFRLVLSPTKLMSSGDVLAIRLTNTDSVSREFTVTAKGVER